jgi:hypothetical protein
MYTLILALTIMTLTIMTTLGLVQLSSVFAAPSQGGNPHGDFGVTPSTGNPHLPQVTPKGNPHLCETIQSGEGSGSTGAGAGKVVIKQC